MPVIGLLIVALAVTDPDYKIPNADECEQRSEETPNENPAPLAEHAVDDQSQPVQRDVPVPTDAPIIESRNCPGRGVANGKATSSILILFGEMLLGK